MLLTTLMGLILPASFSALATNVDLSAGYYNTQEVLEFGRKFQVVKAQLSNAGYELHQCEEQPIYYFVAPTEDVFLHNKTECQYSIPRDPDNYSLRTDYASVVIDIHYNQVSYLYHEGNVDVSYFTVY